MIRILLVAGAFFIQANLHAQTFTMGKKCQEQNTNGMNLIKEKKYQEALDIFIGMEKSCTTKDGKEASAVGRAEALNGLGKYQEAIEASDQALKVTKDKSLQGYFQKAVAQYRLKQYDAANATFSQVIALTEKNQDAKARANNYAIMASLRWKQLGQKDSAMRYLDKATALDPENPNFVIQKGDMFVDEKKYDEAFAEYDKAIQMGKADLEMYTIRSNTRMKMMQEKYKTTQAQELKAKMTSKEKDLLCTELGKAISLGLKDMKQDMFNSLVCK